MRTSLLAPLVLVVTTLGCEGGSIPVDLEVKEGILAGGKLDDLQLVVKTLPGAQIQFEGQTKDTGDKGEETFTISKGKLKLGSNTFKVEATQSSLFSKKTGAATASWVAGPKTLLRFYPPAPGSRDFEGDISCGGIMCGGTTLKVTKDGHLPLEIESAFTGTASIDGQKANLSPAKRAAVDVDLTKKLGTMTVLKEDLSLPIVLEGGGATTDMLDVSGPAVTVIAARTFAAVEKGPVLFAGESPAPPGKKADLLVVVGAPSSKLVIVGKPGKYQDVDLVAVAKVEERFFGCGSTQGGPGILYRDLAVKVHDRRTGAAVGTRKLLADRVACPPTPTGIVKGEVREDDLKRVLAELLAK